MKHIDDVQDIDAGYANSRAIEAAPDMLEALLHIEKELIEGEYVKHSKDAIRKVKQAIKKAGAIVNTIYTFDQYRIVEMEDKAIELDNLKGDCFCPKTNHDICPEKLLKEELAFEQKVENEGVFGYALEVWNPEIGEGWEHVDSCWGFVGAWDRETNNHYIVDELITQIGIKTQARGVQ